MRSFLPLDDGVLAELVDHVVHLRGQHRVRVGVFAIGDEDAVAVGAGASDLLEAQDLQQERKIFQEMMVSFVPP